MKRARPLLALAVALALGGWLLFGRPARPPAPAPQGLPQALRTVSTPPHAFTGRLADGAVFTPQLYPGVDVSVGVAPTPDGSAERLVLRSPAGDRELRRIEQQRYPQFLGFTTAGGVLYWAESTATAAGPYETRLWRAELAGSAPPVSLTADTGAAVFFDSEFDLVVAEGRLHWVAAPPDTEPDTAPQTELRSVPVGGGPVTVGTTTGRYRRSVYPWLQSVDQGSPVQLVNQATGERRAVPSAAAEQVLCTPTWCRSVIQTAEGRNLFDVMRADGSQRRRLPGEVNAVTVDVALAGRFELLTTLDGGRLRLLAYELDTGTTLVLATDIGIAAARAGVVWWTTSAESPDEWRSLDLRALT